MVLRAMRKTLAAERSVIPPRTAPMAALSRTVSREESRVDTIEMRKINGA
eukprot:IDg22369t1